MPGPAAPRPPLAAAPAAAPTVYLPVPPVPGPPAPDPSVRDTGSLVTHPDPGTAVIACIRSGVPDARIKEEWMDGSRTGRIDRDRPQPASRY